MDLIILIVLDALISINTSLIEDCLSLTFVSLKD